MIRFSHEKFHYQSVSFRWYASVTMISNSGGVALVIHFSNETAVSPNLTLVIRLSNENPVSPNLSLVIRCGDTVIRSLFTEFAFATVNLYLNFLRSNWGPSDATEDQLMPTEVYLMQLRSNWCQLRSNWCNWGLTDANWCNWGPTDANRGQKVTVEHQLRTNWGHLRSCSGTAS